MPPAMPVSVPLHPELSALVEHVCVGHGTRVTYRSEPRDEVVSVAMVIDSGLVDDAKGREGTARLALASWLTRQTGAGWPRTRLRELGTVSYRVTPDVTEVFVRTTHGLLGRVYDILGSAFVPPDPAVLREQLPTLQSHAELDWLQRSTDLSASGDYLYPTLFPAGHPYARMGLENPGTYQAISEADIAAQMTTNWRPETATVHLVGKVTKADAVEFARHVPDPSAMECVPPQTAEVAVPERKGVTTVERVVPSLVRVEESAWVLPPASGPDAWALDLVRYTAAVGGGATCVFDDLELAAVLRCQREPRAGEKLLPWPRIEGGYANYWGGVVEGRIVEALDDLTDMPLGWWTIEHQHRLPSDPLVDTLDLARHLVGFSISDFVAAWVRPDNRVVGINKPGAPSVLAMTLDQNPWREAGGPAVLADERFAAASHAAPLVFASPLAAGTDVLAVEVPGATLERAELRFAGGSTLGARPELAQAVWDQAEWTYRNVDVGDRMPKSHVTTAWAVDRYAVHEGWGGPRERLDLMLWGEWKRLEGRIKGDLASRDYAQRRGLALREIIGDGTGVPKFLSWINLFEGNPWAPAYLRDVIKKAQNSPGSDWNAVLHGTRQASNGTLLMVGGARTADALAVAQKTFATWPVPKAAVPTRVWEPQGAPTPGRRATVVVGVDGSVGAVALACRLGDDSTGAILPVIDELFTGVTAEGFLAQAGMDAVPGLGVIEDPVLGPALRLNLVTGEGNLEAAGLRLVHWVTDRAAHFDDALVHRAASRVALQDALNSRSSWAMLVQLRDALSRPTGLASLDGRAERLQKMTAADVQAVMAPCSIRQELAFTVRSDRSFAKVEAEGFVVTRLPFAEWLATVSDEED